MSSKEPLAVPQACSDERRLAALRRYNILDTPQEPAFDDLVRLAATLCDTPIAAITFIEHDRLWIKSEIGFGLREAPVDATICVHALGPEELLLIPDTAADDRFRQTSFVTGPPRARFYAGAVLRTPDGHAIGTLCVLDHHPRDLTAPQRDALCALARQVMAQLELRQAQTHACEARATAEDKRAEAAVRASEERFRAAFDQAIVGMALVDPKGRILRVNNAFCKMLGMTPDELLGRDSLTYTHPDDRAANVDNLHRLETANTDRAVFQKRYIRKDGETVWTQVYISPTYDTGGRTTEFIAIVDDISHRKRAERELKDLAEQRRLALNSARMGWWHLDPATGDVSWDERFREIFGVADERLEYEKVIALMHPDDRARVDEAVKAATRTDNPQPYSIDYRVTRSDGSIRWVHAEGQAYYAGKGSERRYSSFIGTLTDITDRRRIEGALATEKRVLEQIAAGAPLPDVLETLIRGMEAQSTDGMLCSVLLLDERGDRLLHGAAPSLPETYNRAIHGLHIGPGVGSCGTAAHERRLVCVADIATDPLWADFRDLATAHDLRACCSTPIIASQGDVLGTIAMYYRRPHEPSRHDRELTEAAGHLAGIAIERKRAEQRVQQSLEAEQHARAEAERASRMKDEFLATLSHELRTPLNAILGWSQILMGSPEKADLVKQGLATIERNARVQTQIIEDLLDMSRIISGKVRLDVQRLDLASVVKAAVETVQPAAEAKTVRLQAVLDPLAGPVMGDPNRLQQVFWNLLSNAVKFTPKGGRVQVLVERVDSHLEVSVIDTGEGIRPEFLSHVFDRFRQADASTTRRHGGLGLGLAIVKQLVELHGGSVRVKSLGPGHGSTFIVSLPLTVIHPDPAPEIERRHPTAGAAPTAGPDLCARIAGVRVLVVDDEPDARTLVRRLLEDCDAIVTTAASASEALERVTVDRPDVLVSDIGMPGEDGYTLIRRVRSLGPERGGTIPAVALTAYARAEDRMRAVLAGFQMHVAKPVEAAELITMVASLAGRTG